MDLARGANRALRGCGAPADLSLRDPSAAKKNDFREQLATYQWSSSEAIHAVEERPSAFQEGPAANVRLPALRVALFTGNYLTVPDGVSRTLTRLVDYLHAVNLDVLVVGPPGSDGVVPPGCEYVDVPSIPMPGRSEYRLALGLPRSVCRVLDRFEPDIIHVATPDLLGIGALNFAEARGIPAVATYHTHFPEYLRFYHFGFLHRPVESFIRWFYNRTRHVYAPTPRIATYLNDLGLRERIRMWGRGVDGRRFHPRHRSEKWRQMYGIRPDDVVVAFVGRLVKEKGLSVFADAVDVLQERFPSVRSVIVGEGPMRQHLENRLPSTLFLGHLEGEALSTAYASSDIFLFPSTSEAFGNVIVEAMASGLPVVAAAETGCSSHVIPGETGDLARPDDVRDFVSRVAKLVNSRNRRIRMGMNARRHAETYDWSRTLDRMVRYYLEVCSNLVPA